MGNLLRLINNTSWNLGPYRVKNGEPGQAKKNLYNLPQDLAEKKLLQELKARDREVRAHERAHLLAAGPYARAMSLKTIKGPDGKQYAVAGEVKIDTSPIPRDPEKTLEKARKIKRAALAPLHPSAQDLRVAATADQMAQKALMEIIKQRLENQGTNPYQKSPEENTGQKVDLKV